jgi:hypothetical protein
MKNSQLDQPAALQKGQTATGELELYTVIFKRATACCTSNLLPKEIKICHYINILIFD